jgi:hypothetical protein
VVTSRMEEEDVRSTFCAKSLTIPKSLHDPTCA